MRPFDHDRLDVYRAALELAIIISRIARVVPTGYSSLGDQLRRASTSIVLNIAEGAGEFAGPEKARFYRLARRSATECAAALDIRMALQEGVDPRGRQEVAEARNKLLRIVPMLVMLARGAEAGGGEKG